ncbi:RNA-directed DNA polymerase [Vibrio sp. F13]|uniref:RNA-directed DNA polymerase n=1 Tax=Vibrio sp. F13 TaxID=2070777 RepID=UPI0010BDFE37|nr:RNA-directed DNA polymerase [Vibrio sp. F13]TKG06073.1 RNA-directed DNA polymerase [Vibrio sp. F13]
MTLTEHQTIQLQTELLQCAQQCGKSIQKSLAKPDLVQLCHQLARDIAHQTYRIQPFQHFAVKEPKLREIYAPNFADRIVQQWIIRHLAPLINKRLIDDTYANRKGKGAHAAIDKLQRLMRQPQHQYYLQLDVRSFFNHIHRPRLLTQVVNLIRMKSPYSAQRSNTLIYLLSGFLDIDVTASPHTFPGSQEDLQVIPPHKRLTHTPKEVGLPIGGVLSQWLANYYLSPLDHLIKHQLKVKGYVRYMDDLILLSHCADQLTTWKKTIEQALNHHLQLHFHPNKERLSMTDKGADYLGYIVYPHHKHIRKRTLSTFKQRIALFNALLDSQAFPFVTRPSCGVCSSHRFAALSANETPDGALLAAMLSTLNSYLGLLTKANHCRLRKHLYHQHFHLLKRYFIPADPNYQSVKIKACWRKSIECRRPVLA